MLHFKLQILTVVGISLAGHAGQSRLMRPLTGEAGQPQGTDFGDPSPPDFSQAGHVKIYTTGGEVLVWQEQKNLSAAEAFFQGQPAQHEHLKLYHADGKTLIDAEKFGEDPWDPSFETVGGKRVLYAGVMSPTDDRKNAVWPADHWNRRTYAFLERAGRWVMQPQSIFGAVPETPTWLGHNYGHAVIEDEFGRPYFIYEKVSSEKNAEPWTTEIFAQRMAGALRLEGPEIKILGFGKKVWPAARRHFGGNLLEGPRPFRFQDFYLVAFSAGDYTSDHYGLHLMWSKHIEGPYQAYLTPDGEDLKDFGQEIEKDFELTWGAGRPAFFQRDGKWWVLFHGILKTDDRPLEDGKRNIYLAPVRIEETRRGGPPRVRILKEDPDDFISL